MFKKNAAQLTPTSKIQFYSDSNKVNLIAEINAGSEGRKDLPPLLLNHGKIWVQFDAGTNALLPKHLQNDQRSMLPCAVVQIPNTWTVCCWLTETITNSLLQNIQNNFKFSVEIFEKLIGALTSFYEEAKAPSMLKSIVFNILSRLIIKLRHIYRKRGLSKGIKDEDKQNLLMKHFERLFIKKDFIQTLLSELLIHKTQEEHSLQFQAEGQKQQILYTAFMQDCVELLLIMMMPSTSKSVSMTSYKDLYDATQFEMPEWLSPLIKALYFMQYFSGEMALSRDILREIHAETQPLDSCLDQIIILKGIPSQKNAEGEPNYSRELIKEEIIKLVKKHGARILNLESDIKFSDDSEQVVIILDGLEHMSLAKDALNGSANDSSSPPVN